MTRRPRFLGLQNGDLMRIARRVTVLDLIDGAAFVLLSLGVIVLFLSMGV